MTNDSFHTYTYDAEGNITQVDGGSTAQYVYDVFNRRIHVQTPSATTEYTYDYAGRRISSWLSPNNTVLRAGSTGTDSSSGIGLPTEQPISTIRIRWERSDADRLRRWSRLELRLASLG